MGLVSPNEILSHIYDCQYYYWSIIDSHTCNVQLRYSIDLAVWYDVTKDFNLAVVKRTTKIISQSNWWDAMVLPYIQCHVCLENVTVQLCTSRQLCSAAV